MSRPKIVKLRRGGAARLQAPRPGASRARRSSPTGSGSAPPTSSARLPCLATLLVRRHRPRWKAKRGLRDLRDGHLARRHSSIVAELGLSRVLSLPIDLRSPVSQLDRSPAPMAASTGETVSFSTGRCRCASSTSGSSRRYWPRCSREHTKSNGATRIFCQDMPRRQRKSTSWCRQRRRAGSQQVQDANTGSFRRTTSVFQRALRSSACAVYEIGCWAISGLNFGKGLGLPPEEMWRANYCPEAVAFKSYFLDVCGRNIVEESPRTCWQVKRRGRASSSRWPGK